MLIFKNGHCRFFFGVDCNLILKNSPAAAYASTQKISVVEKNDTFFTVPLELRVPSRVERILKIAQTITRSVMARSKYIPVYRDKPERARENRTVLSAWGIRGRVQSCKKCRAVKEITDSIEFFLQGQKNLHESLRFTVVKPGQLCKFNKFSSLSGSLKTEHNETDGTCVWPNTHVLYIYIYALL